LWALIVIEFGKRSGTPVLRLLGALRYEEG
jgi:hypothetical protein